MEQENLPINSRLWHIVRYTRNGVYDCIWSSGHTLRDALKRCKQLNEDYHKYYGVYVVEDNDGNQYV